MADLSGAAASGPPDQASGADEAVVDGPMPVASGAVVGCGVIGAAWASRLVLSGVDVAISDPSPDAEQIFRDVLDNATAAWSELDLDISRPGRWRIATSIGDAVAGADFVQESVPERPDIKAAVYGEIEAGTSPTTLIASSTSGIRPTLLQAGLAHPDRLVVGHPYNPVYLLPVVEVVAGQQTTPDTVDRAQQIYRSIGMHPVVVRVEIDAFIGDRLLEAVWREALWLINDGVATTQEIDDVITHGFGLRWGQMGLFETYRVAGGTGGFRHFLEQFGPTLEWPWTKLMDTPDFTPELVDRIVSQSDDQSGQLDVRELERIRDRNIIGFLTTLEAHDWAAGRALASQRRRQNERAIRPTP